jgi:hypothetical protein
MSEMKRELLATYTVRIYVDLQESDDYDDAIEEDLYAASVAARLQEAAEKVLAPLRRFRERNFSVYVDRSD